MSALSEAELSASGRRLAIRLIGWGLMMPLVGCGKGMQKETVLNVVMYSYLDRPIHNIIFNGTGLGITNSYGGTGTIAGVRIPFGVQVLKWTLGGPEGMARNGEKMTVKNQLVISPEQIPAGTRYLGLHLYPDDTAEITFNESIPDTTARSNKILAAKKE
ncbi:hypothetical protein [Undibacterium sp.]|uniref:hypothetical protein n=1 Tax=Undibacterium sp. TaxID=1914977 RepID=UPI00374DE819